MCEEPKPSAARYCQRILTCESLQTQYLIIIVNTLPFTKISCRNHGRIWILLTAVSVAHSGMTFTATNKFLIFRWIAFEMMQLYYFPSVFQEYQKISGRDIEDSIKREMSGCLEDVFLAIGMSVLWHIPPNCNSKMEGILYRAVFAAGLLSGGTVQCRKNIAVTA